MNTERLTRRELLKNTGLIAGIIAVPGAVDWGKREAERGEALELTYEQAVSDATRFSRLLEAIPEEARFGIRTDEDLLLWTMEIMPYFEYEGIVEDKKPGEYNGLVYPPVMSFVDYQDGLMSHHVLGRTQVFTDEIDMNARIINPVSAWYGREDSIGTLVHELAHAQGIKFPAPSSPLDEESSAQLVTLEVLSAMVNHGNELVIPALLDELRHMNMQAAHCIAIRDGFEERFLADRAQILPNSLDLAASEKADRQWADYKDEDKFPYILDAYNYRPMNAVYHGMRHNDEIYGVRLPINWLVDMINEPYSGHTTPGGYGVEATPEPVPPRYGLPPAPLPLIIDDLHYFYDHADSLTGALLDS